ncbi:hypothetical protein [Rhodococcus qingshengii]|uniref:hypothetical protein n=1 Tax=Rhodococcus qingshengii TaxID=334542 RepID=UPI001BECD66D|nr:hypothetical protein [Rhodococcus qingshengii]MBT2271797.1 hypothetical protein [Rhodococcus qingshengii]
MPAPKPKSEAEAFSEGMNHVFERSIGDILETLVVRSASADKLITENEMQTVWTTSNRATASACDWVIKAGKTCIVVDATNHSLDMFLSQGHGTPEAYAKDMNRVFASADGKFGQLAKTMRNLCERASRTSICIRLQFSCRSSLCLLVGYPTSTPPTSIFNFEVAHFSKNLTVGSSHLPL